MATYKGPTSIVSLQLWFAKIATPDIGSVTIRNSNSHVQLNFAKIHLHGIFNTGRVYVMVWPRTNIYDISSYESQKGVIAIQRCSVWEPEGRYWFWTKSMICNNALLALNWRYHRHSSPVMIHVQIMVMRRSITKCHSSLSIDCLS